MLSTLLTLFIIAIVGLVVISLVTAVLGMALSMVGFLLFKVAPILLIGWLVMKVVRRRRVEPRISAADQRWLDS